MQIKGNLINSYVASVGLTEAFGCVSVSKNECIVDAVAAD